MSKQDKRLVRKWARRKRNWTYKEHMNTCKSKFLTRVRKILMSENKYFT